MDDRSSFWTEPLPDDLHSYAVRDVLKDGGSVLVRAIRPDDKPGLVDLFQRLSPRSIYFRFMGTKKRLTEEELVRFTELDFIDHVGLAVTLRDVEREHIIGVGRYIAIAGAIDDGQRRADVAFAVDDSHQGRGIGTLLLEHLARLARANGVVLFEADVLGENNQMLDVFAHSGFRASRSFEGGVFHVSFPVSETSAVIEAEHVRERHASAQSLHPILEPRAVALVGASRRPRSIGHALLANLKRHGFPGPIYPIHPVAKRIAGLPAFPRVSAVGQPIDLAVIAVPAPAVEEVVADCVRAGVRGVVVISAGFAEVSNEGRACERRLRDQIRESGLRMVGPNCMGVINTNPAAPLDATFAASTPPAGNVGFLSQSGALGIALLDDAKRRGLGISTFVSVGNKADVSGNDLLAYWAEDERTQVIALYLESFGNPRKFARVAPEVARTKPVIAVKSGRSRAGRRAAASHSAALANSDVAVDALFEQAGVIRAKTLEELFDVAALLSTQPLPPGPRVGIVTNAGGPGILLADACEDAGLSVPELDRATRAQLATFLSPHAATANPVDTIASATAQQFGRAVEVVGAADSVDAVVAVFVQPFAGSPDDAAAALALAAGRVPKEKPVVAVFVGTRGAPPAIAQGPRGQLPVYEFPENAAQALAAAHRYARWRRRPRGEIFHFDPFATSAIRAVVDRVLSTANGQPVWVSAMDLATLLRAAGLHHAEAVVARTENAGVMAEELGYPLVAKAIAPGLVHKSDVGGVIVGLRSRFEVEQAVTTLADRMRRAGTQLEAVLLQRQVQGGIEALVGVTSEPTFGPLVVCGLGGVQVELLRDAAFRLTPVSDLDAAEMLERLRSKKLLDGYRGQPAGDRAALARVIQRVAALVEVVPELTDLDLNPIKVMPPGEGTIIVDARLQLTPS
ncbi:MAG: GNAT family N-acetyltransferase [bacterium]